MKLRWCQSFNTFQFVQHIPWRSDGLHDLNSVNELNWLRAVFNCSLWLISLRVLRGESSLLNILNDWNESSLC
jgi:hypothetical protein